jgi:DNA-binding XRE family transcriptional regulator
VAWARVAIAVRPSNTERWPARRWQQCGSVPVIPRDLIDDSHQPLVVPLAWLEGRFADWLRERMTERGVTQRMVALRSGINHSTISRLLDENRQPTLATAIALLHVLGDEPVRLPRLIQVDAS